MPPPTSSRSPFLSWRLLAAALGLTSAWALLGIPGRFGLLDPGATSSSTSETAVESGLVADHLLLLRPSLRVDVGNRLEPYRDLFQRGRSASSPASRPGPDPILCLFDETERRPSPPNPPRLPPDVRLLGIFGPGNLRIAVFRTPKGLLNLREGETLRDAWVVERIESWAIDVRRVEVGAPRVRWLPDRG